MTVVHKFRSDVTDYSLGEGTVLQDRYRVVRQLGHGGMGAVYEAVDERLGITVALKETLSSEESMRKQFEHEARLLANMQHPALPRVSDHFVEGDRAFLVMQYIGGVDLAKIIAQQPGPFPRDQVIAWADQLLDALIYLHSRDRQVIHRDIKPHNLKVTSNGQIALLDFGLAKAQPADQSLTASRAFFGYTKHYAPLEQIQDHRTDQRSDIYALGATLYHLLTGVKPPDALVRATALINSEPDPLKPADDVHPAVGPQIAAILRRAMAQKSESRFATAAEFREALRRMGRQRDVESAKQNLSGVRSVEVKTKPQIGDLPVMTWPMANSARRFGVGTITAILIVVAALATGVWYVSPHVFPLSNRLENRGVATSATSDPQNATGRKAEKVRAPEGAVVTPKIRESEPAKAAKNERPAETKKPYASAPPAVVPRATFPRQNRRPLSAPSIKLPSPDIADGPRLTSSNTDSREHDSANGVPRFYR